MSQAFWRNGMNGSATFSLFFRGFPEDRGFYAVSGIDEALSYLESVRFNSSDLDYLRSTSLFDPRFLEHLENFRFGGTVRTMREGTIAFGDEPIIEVTAPLIEGQIVETALLNAVTFPTAALTKAVRIKQAAAGKPVVEFGARRAQGPDTADIASRCAAIAGFAGTSNLHAAAEFDLPIAGTMAHAFVQSFETELEAFRSYAAEFPDSTTLLVDTYDTLQGIRNAITVGLGMKERGEYLRAVRLDSGDMAALAVQARKMLDEAGLTETRVVATGGLDEHSLAELVATGAPIDSYGVGTRYVVSSDAPYLDSVYKLVEYNNRHTRKYSPGKQTLPGPKQVFRVTQDRGFVRDLIGTTDETPTADGTPLLEPTLQDGRRVRPADTVESAAKRLSEQLASLPDGVQTLRDPERYPVELTATMESLRDHGATD